MLRSDTPNDPADCSTANELNFSQTRVTDDGFSHSGAIITRALDFVQTSGGKSRLGEDFKHKLVSPWTQFGGLEDNGTPGC